MKLRTFGLFAILSGAAIAVAACQPTNGSRTARLIGTHDLVLVSDNTDAGILATKTADPGGGGFLSVGVPSRFLYVTSADTNELRVLDNYPAGGGVRIFSAAPNPLETLSIPVLDRPTLLAVDEGRNAEGSRVTGNYVYAARPGGAEVSVVSVLQKRQLNGKPFSAPAPVTAIGAFMEVDRTQRVLETPMPANTSLYLATWDGDFAAIYRATLPTTLTTELETLDYERLLLIGQTPITAMLIVAPLANRTLDGAPFCATTACLALSTRSSSGAGGEAFMFDPATGQRAALAYSGPVRKLVSSSNGGRIYGVLDEQACGGPACGGIVAVDVVAALTPSAPPLVPTFPPSKDATGANMPPLRTGDGLITGLTVGYFHRNVDGVQSSGTLRTTIETNDGGSLEFLQQDFTELGAFASSSGAITFFSGLAGSIIDFDAHRTTVTSATVRLPGSLPDGGLAFFSPDGGVLGSNAPLTVTPLNPSEDTFRVVNVAGSTDNSTWTVDISDGYLQTQILAFVYQGQIPGLVALPTTAADGVRLATGGFELRAAVGDIVRFEQGDDTTGFVECGSSTVATVGAGFIEVADSPAGCADRVRFTVRADGSKKLVAAAELEGYLGRFAPGDTLTYNRPYLLLPPGVVAPRTALTVNIAPSVPEFEGAIVSFLINGFIVPYQVTFDTASLNLATGGGGCSNSVTTQVVMGNMVMDRLPTYVSPSEPLNFRWAVMGVVPSGNATVEVVLPNANAGILSGNESGGAAAYCRR